MYIKHAKPTPKKATWRPKKATWRPKISSIYVSISPSIGDIYVSLPISLPIYLSIDLSIDLSIYLSNLLGRREHATCRSKMPAKTWQGDEWRKPCISNMPSRRQKRPPEDQKRPPEGQKCHPSMSLSLHPSEICMSLSLSPYLSIYRSIYLSVKLARPTWTCNLQVKNASYNMAGRRMA